MKVLSPLRYPGSKRKLIKYFNKILTRNNFSPKVVVEPFVGGGSLFLSFLGKQSVQKVIIADKDPLVSGFWNILLFHTERLIRFINTTEVTLSQFDYYRIIAGNPNQYSELQRAHACLFLNRTSFSGILNPSAGPIGGREQVSDYRIDCRFGKRNLIKRIREIAMFKEKVTVLASDWTDTVKYCLKQFTYEAKEFLFYFDPPFYKKADQLYRHYFHEKDHEALRDELVKLEHPWILSYDKTNEIKNLYIRFKKIHVQMPYSINSPATRLEKELIITPLELPRISEKRS